MRSAGAKGDGVAGDYQVLQDLIIRAANTGRIVFIDAGVYKITKTLYIPKETKIVGEAYPVIMSGGWFFAGIDSPQPVVQVIQRGEENCVEWCEYHRRHSRAATGRHCHSVEPRLVRDAFRHVGRLCPHWRVR